MTASIARPADPYSPEWALFYEQHPHLRRSVGAAGDDGGDGGGGGGESGDGGESGGGDGGQSGGGSGDGGRQEPGDTGPDLSFIPEQFRTQDGKPDVNAFKVHYDDLAAQKAQADERKAAIPEKPDGYEFNVPALDDLELPEGFNKENFSLDVIKDDPDIPRLKATAHERGWTQEDVNAVAKLVAQREVRQMHDSAQTATEEMKKLGDNAQNRIDTLSRTVRGRLPEAQADALLNDLTSADAIRAVETVLASANRQANGAQPGGRPNMGEMSIDERLRLAAEQRQQNRRGSRTRG